MRKHVRFAASHGMCKTPEYYAWAKMVERCENPNNSQWPDYGGRGVSVYPAWRDSFMAFFESVGPRPSASHSIDRINNDGNYEPGNVRWSTRFEQNRNTRYNRFLELDGKRQCITDWSRELGLSVGAILGRLRRGLSVRDALTAPLQRRGRHARKLCA